MKRALSILILLATILVLSSCRFSNDDNILRYDIGGDPKTLDPQASGDKAGEIVLSHVMEGLFEKDENGKIVPACVKNYTVSENGLTYTFTLHDELFWSNGTRLTSDDFLFAFTRLFLSETKVADISGYLSIKNAAKVYKGELPVSALGISTPDEATLIIELDYKDSSLLQTLSLVSSSPCNREFFEKTKGKYGIDHKNMIYNNRFVINDWKQGSYITLRPNNDYRNQNAIKSDGINFYTYQDIDTKQRFFDGTTDVVSLSSSDIKSLDSGKFKSIEFSCTTWALAFNQEKDIFKNESLRKAFLLCSQSISTTPDKEIFSVADRILPPALESKYAAPVLASSQSPFNLCQTALKELKLDALPTISVICPDYYDFRLYLTYLQKAWLNELGVAVNFEVLSESDFNSALESRNFDLIIMPITADSGAQLGVFNSFTSSSGNNYISYRNEDYDLLVSKASQQTDIEQQLEFLYEAEKHLIQTAVLTPIFHEKEYLGINTRVENIVINPLGPEIDFSFANKK